MSMPTITLSDATEADMVAIQAIYAWHVQYGLASFETEPPSLQDMLARRVAVVSKALPWLAAKRGDEVLGYCYLTPYRPRYAYRFSVEDSVYIHPDHQGQGLGYRLLSEAIARAEQGGWRQMLAVIGNSENQGSMRLHQKLGFSTIGQLSAVGFKHGRWVNTLLMQRAIGDGDNTLPTE